MSSGVITRSLARRTGAQNKTAPDESDLVAGKRLLRVVLQEAFALAGNDLDGINTRVAMTVFYSLATGAQVSSLRSVGRPAFEREVRKMVEALGGQPRTVQ